MTTDMKTRLARLELRQRQNERHGFSGLHGAKRIARGDYLGGYEHYAVMEDGALLCSQCVRDNWRDIVFSHRADHHDGWRVAGITHDGNLEDLELCAHCNRVLSEPLEDDTPQSPVAISPRLLPGVRIGKTWLSVEPTDRTDHRGSPHWRYHIDTPEWEYSADDLAGWGNASDMLATLCGFLAACAESRAYATRTGRDSENSDLFPDHVGEWAELYSDELAMVQLEIEKESTTQED